MTDYGFSTLAIDRPNRSAVAATGDVVPPVHLSTTFEMEASMSASNLSVEERQRAGISESLVRAPVGIEDRDDLIDDLASALGNL